MNEPRARTLTGFALLLAIAAVVAWNALVAPVSDGPKHGGVRHDDAPQPPGLAGRRSVTSMADDAAEGAPIMATDAGAEMSPEPTDPSPRPAGWPADAPTLLCRVQIVDAVTGAAIDKRWHLRRPTSASPPPPPGEDVRPARESPPAPPQYDWRVRSAGEASALRHDDAESEIHCIPEVDLPNDDYVQWERPDTWASVAAGVEQLVVRVPLRRALVLEVELVGPSGAPARGARLTRVRVAGRTLWHDHWGAARYDVDDLGVARISGIPLVPGARVEGDVTWLPPAPDGTEAEIHESATPPLSIPIPAAAPSPWRAVVRLAGPTQTPSELPDHSDEVGGNSTDNDVAEPPVPRGSVVVSAFGWDGRPLAGVRVEAPGATGTTGPGGLVRFDGLAVGDAVFTLDARNRFRASVTASVREGVVGTVALTEPQGGRLELVVLGEDHNSCSTAHIHVEASGLPSWFDVEGGTQRLDPFTDESGRRTISRVAPGHVWVRATSADGRTAEARVVVRDRETHALTLVVRRPKEDGVR